jgi:site-specific DNA-methyltransferase (adenine-specific)
VKIYTGNCLDILPTLEAGSVDMVLADLPYGQTQNGWDRIIDIPRMWNCIRHVAKPNAAVALMAAQPFAAHLICSNEAEFRYDLIWRKNKATGFANARRQPLRNHEHVLIFYRRAPLYCPQKTEGHKPGNKATRKGMGSNYGDMAANTYGGNTDRFPVSVQDFPIINNDDPEKIHPTQKPVALMEWLIRSYTQPGDTVMDCTMGSGTTGVACQNTGRDFVGIEIAPEYVAAAERRINLSAARAA